MSSYILSPCSITSLLQHCDFYSYGDKIVIQYDSSRKFYCIIATYGLPKGLDLSVLKLRQTEHVRIDVTEKQNSSEGQI